MGAADPVALDDYDQGLVDMVMSIPDVLEQGTENAVPNTLPEDFDLVSLEKSLGLLMKVSLKGKRFVQIRRMIHELYAKVADPTAHTSILKRTEWRNILECRKRQLKKLDQEYSSKRRLRAQRFEALDRLQGDSRRLLCGPEVASRQPDLKEPAQLQEQKDVEVPDEEMPQRPLFHHRGCYICKRRFVDLHHFYDQLCPGCAALNWLKRNFRTDLTGKVFLLTGARVKIGFECCKRLLECNATVLATSRFPMDCAKRFAALSNFESFRSRLHVFGIDLRDLKATIRLSELIRKRYTRLDGIINNACQTVRRPPVYYEHLMDVEANPTKHLSPDAFGMVDLFGSVTQDPSLAVAYTASDGAVVDNLPSSFPRSVASSAALSQIVMLDDDLEKTDVFFPKQQLDVNQQQVDLRPKNSWTLLCHEVSPVEIIEVFAVNALSPFILNSRLKPLLKATDGNKFVINVSAMEGKFYRFKGPEHPHTNMAKAALNMLTRTSATDFAKDNIFMNSVDTGWINDENPFDKCVHNAKRNFSTPIDETDAMARILDPILNGIATSELPFGKFFKDFAETEW